MTGDEKFGIRKFMETSSIFFFINCKRLRTFFYRQTMRCAFKERSFCLRTYLCVCVCVCLSESKRERVMEKERERRRERVIKRERRRLSKK